MANDEREDMADEQELRHVTCHVTVLSRITQVAFTPDSPANGKSMEVENTVVASCRNGRFVHC